MKEQQKMEKAETDHSLGGYRHPWSLGSSHWLVGHHKHLLDMIFRKVWQQEEYEMSFRGAKKKS